MGLSLLFLQVMLVVQELDTPSLGIQLSDLCALSTSYCLAICTVLIPANLLCTFVTLCTLRYPQAQSQVRLAAGLGLLSAVALALHVFSWFLLGVVMPPSYVLLSLAALCMGLNLWAAVRPEHLLGWLRFLSLSLSGRYPRAKALHRLTALF
jgi:hypothetical protein